MALWSYATSHHKVIDSGHLPDAYLPLFINDGSFRGGYFGI